MHWYRITVVDQKGQSYTRFGRFENHAEAQKAAALECTQGYGLTVREVGLEPLGDMAVWIYPVPPPYPQS